MKLLEKFEMSMSDTSVRSLTESSIDILVNVNSKGALLEAAEEDEDEEEEECKGKKCKSDEEDCEDDCEGEEDDEELEEIDESQLTLKTLPEMIDENMQITLYSLNEEMTEIVEEKVDFIIRESEEELSAAEVEKEMEKSPKRPLKFLLLDTAKNTKLNRLKSIGTAKKCLVKMAKKSTKLDHVKFLEKDRDTTIKVLKTKKDTLDSYGIQAKVQRFIDWLEGDYKNLLAAKRTEIIATSKSEANKAAEGESVAENYLTKLYSYDEETQSLVESIAIINDDDIKELQEAGKYLSKTMAIVEANLTEKVDSVVANMKSTIAKADKYKLEKMQRDLPVTIAKTNVKKQKALKKGNTEKAKEYDRLLNYLRSGAPNDIKARIRTVQVVKEAAELGIKCELPVVEQVEEAWLIDSLQESDLSDAVSVMMQYDMLGDEGDQNITDKEVEEMPNEIAGEENTGTEGYHPESIPTIKVEEGCQTEGCQKEGCECTGEDDCECTDCTAERNRKKAIKEAKCKK